MKKLILWATVALIAFSSTHQSNAQTNKQTNNLKFPKIEHKIHDNHSVSIIETDYNRKTNTTLYFSYNKLYEIAIESNKQDPFTALLCLDDDGRLISITSDTKKLKNMIIVEGGQKFSKGDYVSKYTEYRNGKKTQEGLLLWYNGESPVINSKEYGEWIYYDESGKETHRKTFK